MFRLKPTTCNKYNRQNVRTIRDTLYGDISDALGIKSQSGNV